jgi:MoxR-like ATPase
MVNAALYLRRPLLVTGKPGTGKTSLAYAVAEELKLGEVLYWPITTRTTLKDGLYGYDAIGRLQDTKLNDGDSPTNVDRPSNLGQIGRYITLGPLGTALFPSDRPRLLLIDEIDKSDLDLPNDLLHAFEEGSFQIPELRRISHQQPQVAVQTADGQTVEIEQGEVRCAAFPIVILTSNGERDFPAPFLRRCLRLEIPEPDRETLRRIAIAHLGPEAAETAHDLIETFLHKRRETELATDQLLNAIYLVMRSQLSSEADRTKLIDQLLQPLSGPGQ